MKRYGTKSMLTGHFAAVRVCAADGPLMSHERHLRDQTVRLVFEVPDNGEREYYFTNQADNTPRITLVRATKARWVCEQGYQQMKDELGLDHYEGRSWLGLHHHALLTMMELVYLQHRRLNLAERSGEKTSAPGAGHHHRDALPAALHALPSLRQHSRPESA
jgi:SRSO17 transposase